MKNVSCARAIGQDIRDHFNEAGLCEGCAQSILETYGFKWVNFVLINSVKQMGHPHLLNEERQKWEPNVPSDGKFNRYFAMDIAASLLKEVPESGYVGPVLSPHVLIRTSYQSQDQFRCYHTCLINGMQINGG